MDLGVMSTDGVQRRVVGRPVVSFEHSDHCRHHLDVPLCSCVFLEYFERPPPTGAGAVLPGVGDGIEGIRHRDDASADGELVTGAAEGVAGSVDPFVMGFDQGGDVVENRRLSSQFRYRSSGGFE